MSIGTNAYKGLANKSLFSQAQGVWRTAKTITAYGNAAISTAQSKFSGASGSLDLSGDYIRLDAASSDFAWGSGAFTYEGWFRFNSPPATVFFFDQRESATSIVAPTLYITSNTLHYYVSNANRISYSWTPTTDVWYHIAVSRSGTSTKLFLDGTQVGSTYTDSGSYVTAGPLNIASTYGSNSSSFNGYVDEFRVSGVARYTSNFTPSTTQFQNDGDTKLLLHFDGTNGSIIITDYVR